MQPGRSPEWNLIAELEPTAWLEAVDMASDGRISLPAPLRRRVGWLKTDASAHLLATIGARGEIRLEPISAWEKLQRGIQSLLESRQPEERAALLIGAMATCFRISLQPDGRLRIPPPLTQHLNQKGGGPIWITACFGLVSIWSDQDWLSHSSSTAVAFRDGVVPFLRPSTAQIDPDH